MTIQRTYHCDGPDCERQWGERAHRELDNPVITNTGWGSLHFCGWDCVLKYAAAKEPEEIIAPEP